MSITDELLARAIHEERSRRAERPDAWQRADVRHRGLRGATRLLARRRSG